MWKKKWAHCPGLRLRARLRADAAKRFAGFAFVACAVAVLAGCGGPGLPAPRPRKGRAQGQSCRPWSPASGADAGEAQVSTPGGPEGGRSSVPSSCGVMDTRGGPVAIPCLSGGTQRPTCATSDLRPPIATRRDPPSQTSLVWLLFPNPALGLQLRAAGHAAGSLSLARRPQVTRSPTSRS